MLTLIAHVRFVLAVVATSPQAPPELAAQAAGEALRHASADVSALEIAAVAYEESKFQDVRGKRAAVCGVMQVATGGREAECRRLLDDRAYSYERGKAKIREARAWCRATIRRRKLGDVCTFAVYGGGNAWREPRPQRYALRVMARIKAIHEVIEPRRGRPAT